MEALIIIPTVNERENLEVLIPEIMNLREGLDVLVVDDNSSDGTAEVAEQFSRETGRVHLMRRPTRMGLGSAYIAGFKYALENTDAKYIFEMDADFSHDPKYLPDFLEAIKDADLVVGSRYLKGISIVNWPMNRLIISKFGNWYARVVTGLPFTDVTAGFKCFRRELLERLDLDAIQSNGYAFQIEMSYVVWRQGFRIKEIPIIFIEREVGDSKITFSIQWEAVWRMWELKFRHLFRKK